MGQIDKLLTNIKVISHHELRDDEGNDSSGVECVVVIWCSQRKETYKQKLQDRNNTKSSESVPRLFTYQERMWLPSFKERRGDMSADFIVIMNGIDILDKEDHCVWDWGATKRHERKQKKTVKRCQEIDFPCRFIDH